MSSESKQETNGQKISFKITLTSHPGQPFRTIKVPEDSPFLSVLKFVCGEFKVNPETSAILSSDGFGINPNQKSGSVWLKFGGNLKLIPRDKVGC